MPQVQFSHADDLPMLAEIGRTGLEQYSGYIYEEWAKQLGNQQRHRIFREMSDNDAVVGAMLHAMEFLIRSVEVSFDAADENEGQARYWADTVDGAFHDMESTQSEFMSEVLTMLPHGHAPLEIVYKLRIGDTGDKYTHSKFGDRLFGWRDLSLRSQETIPRWDFDDDGDVRGLYQQAPPDWDEVHIEAERLLMFRWRSHKKNPEGRSILRNAWRSWYFLKRLQELEAIGIERNIAGLPVIYVPDSYLLPNADPAKKALVESFKKIAAKIRFNEFAGLVMPSSDLPNGNKSGFGFELVSASGRNNTETDAIIRRYESRIAMTVLGEFILLGMDQHGSFALASEKTNLFSVVLKGIMDSIADVMNRKAIPDFVRVNKGDPRFAPKMKFGDIESQDIIKIAQFLTQGVTGAWLTPDHQTEAWARSLVPGMPAANEESIPQINRVFEQATAAANGQRAILDQAA